jgi:hypothetical protein
MDVTRPVRQTVFSCTSNAPAITASGCCTVAAIRRSRGCVTQANRLDLLDMSCPPHGAAARRPDLLNHFGWCCQANEYTERFQSDPGAHFYFSCCRTSRRLAYYGLDNAHTGVDGL